MTSNRDNQADDDKRLNDIVRMARDESGEEFTRPSNSAIEAYLTGNATSAQEQQVRDALLGSEQFRREILELAKAAESLTAQQLLEEFNRADAAEAPSLDSFLNRFGETIVSPEPRKFGMLERLGMLFRSYREQVSAARSYRWRLATVGLSVLSIFIIFYVGDLSFTDKSGGKIASMEWDRVSKMDAGLFVSNVTRTTIAAPETPEYFTSHREAAEAEFMRLIRLENGSYNLDTSLTAIKITGLVRPVEFHLKDQSGNIMGEFRALIPLADQTKPVSYRVWLLTIPARELYTIEIISESAAAIWMPEWGSSGCVAFTYEIDGRFGAFPGDTFSF